METWSPRVNKLSAIQRITLCFMAMCVASAGCSDRLRTYPVNGKVQFKTGGVVHVGTVELKSREHSVHALGPIQSDGSFTLTTYKDGDGAIAGIHDCVVVQFVMAEGLAGHKPSTIGVVDRRYASYSTSGMQVDISTNKKNEIVLEVEGLLPTQPEDHGH
jgi:hypothetical protein